VARKSAEDSGRYSIGRSTTVILLAKPIAGHLQLQRRLFRRSAASRSSKVFPTCNPTAARAEVPKQVSGSDSLRSSPSEADHRFFLKNI
jgi:hypothetical protein